MKILKILGYSLLQTLGIIVAVVILLAPTIVGVIAGSKWWEIGYIVYIFVLCALLNLPDECFKRIRENKRRNLKRNRGCCDE